jgi:hypothetical protein
MPKDGFSDPRLRLQMWTANSFNFVQPFQEAEKTRRHNSAIKIRQYLNLVLLQLTVGVSSIIEAYSAVPRRPIIKGTFIHPDEACWSKDDRTD